MREEQLTVLSVFKIANENLNWKVVSKNSNYKRQLNGTDSFNLTKEGGMKILTFIIVWDEDEENFDEALLAVAKSYMERISV